MTGVPGADRFPVNPETEFRPIRLLKAGEDITDLRGVHGVDCVLENRKNEGRTIESA